MQFAIAMNFLRFTRAQAAAPLQVDNMIVARAVCELGKLVYVKDFCILAIGNKAGGR